MQQVSGPAVIACASKREMVAAAGDEGDVYLWKPDQPYYSRKYHLHQRSNPPDPGGDVTKSMVNCLAFSPNERFLLSCGGTDLSAAITVIK
jgi:WD40 repeat protein